MSAASILSNTNLSTLQGLYQQRKNDFKTMAADVQSGNLSGAQSALSALQQGTSGTQGAGSSQPSQLQADFANLISSIQSGSLSGAQSALGTLQQALPNLSSLVTQAANSSTAATGSTQAGFGQDLASLIQAVQSGNLGGAQQDLTQLQSDMKSLGGGGHHHHHHGGASSATASNTNSSSTGSTTGTTGTNTSNSASAYASMMNLQATSSAMSTLA